jgi:GAF domain-containing protein
MVAPLVAGGKLRSMVYAQVRDIFGQFNEADLDLLAAFANQAAAAIENTRLYQDLEQRVEQRTADLRQRNNELAVINAVQQGLAAELDMQAIYDLVGDKIREIFDAQVVIITIIDYQADTHHIRYMLEDGVRYYPDPFPLAAHMIRMIEKPEPVLLNTSQSIKEYGMQTLDETKPSKSVLGVPLVSGGVVRGVISLQNLDREYAFDEEDVRLLSTLANSMSVALENARLFEETNRLLEETKQRNAELAVISTVQQGLASQLNQEAILALVGDQVREIFDSQVVTINRFDTDNDLAEYLYVIEKGERLEVAPQPLHIGIKRMIKDQ